MIKDISRVLISSQEIETRLAQMAKEIECDCGEKPLKVVILLQGALWFATDLTRKITRPIEIETLRATSYLGTKSRGNVAISEINFEVENSTILLVDDIIDTGRTLSEVSQKLRDAGAKTIKTAVLLDKMAPRALEFSPDYVGFQIPNEFVVGYGLDYNGRYRNLPFIGVLAQSAISQ